MLMKNIMPDN
ncbi:hypothetical protein SS209_03751 [Salmonella enterica subsp. enterica serovar Senftenberg str. SS209]|nr:hypothetical protein SS209_03751 [Salmonella enterica subsp. enterica serovar Senftenberg str. SS209]